MFLTSTVLDKKEKHYTEMSNTITTLYENNNMPLSNVNIWESILELMIEDEE